MAKKVALNRLRQISKHRTLRASAIADATARLAEDNEAEAASAQCSTASSPRV